MNAKLLLVLSLAGAAYAQTNLENNHLDRLSPKAREFVEKYKAEKLNKKINGNAQKRKVVLKSDVLGRKLNRGQFQDSTVYIVEDDIEPKMEVTVADLTVEDVDIEPISAQHSYNGEKKEEIFWLNGKKIDKKSFLKKADDWEKRRIKKQKPLKSSYKAFLTPAEMENKLLSSEDIYIEDGDFGTDANSMRRVTYTPGYNDGRYYIEDFATIPEAINISQIVYAHAEGNKGKDIGIYYYEKACANVSQILIPSNHKAMDCGTDSRPHATAVVNILQRVAPDATIYGYNENKILKNVAGPDKPQSFSPQIYIGTTSLGFYNKKGKHTTSYETIDAEYDNYIYTHGVTEFLAAGNYETERQSQQTVKSPGKAVNAITVGAMNPFQSTSSSGVYGYFYMPYSNYINSEIGNAKPDIMNIGNFYDVGFVGYDGYFDGTSAATPYTAAMAADLMTKHPFFKGHPEMVKPVFLTSVLGNTIQSRDTDGGAVPGIPVYNLMASNKNFSGYWRNYKDEQLFKDADGNGKAISFDIDGVVAGEKYKLAISWLMKGSTIKKLKKIPLNFTVLVIQNDGNGHLNLLASAFVNDNKTQNVVLPFTIQRTGKLFVMIYRADNLAPKDPITLGYHMALQP